MIGSASSSLQQASFTRISPHSQLNSSSDPPLEWQQMSSQRSLVLGALFHELDVALVDVLPQVFRSHTIDGVNDLALIGEEASSAVRRRSQLARSALVVFGPYNPSEACSLRTSSMVLCSLSSRGAPWIARSRSLSSSPQICLNFSRQVMTLVTAET